MKTKAIALLTALFAFGAIFTYLIQDTNASEGSELITYQGKLTNASGNPLADGQYWLGARIWDQASGGTVPLWARKYQVPVSGGTFSLMLGAAGTAWDTPAPLSSSLKLANSGGNRWVEITVMSDANGAEKPEAEWQVLAPRQSLTAVPFAHNGVPTGTVVAFAGTSAPDGWTLCDGQSRNGTDPRFAGLFQVIGLTYGGSGTSFFVPDLRGRTAIGAGQGSGLSNRTLAQKMGAETHALSVAEMPPHSHTGTTNVDGAHAHTVQVRVDGSANQGAAEAGSGNGDGTVTTSNAGAHSHTFTTNLSGGGAAHPIMQPSIVLNYIIKL